MTETKTKPVRYMDFIGTRRAASSDPFVSRPATKPANKPAIKPAAKPAVKPVKKPAPRPELAIKVEKTKEKAYISREPAKSRDLYPTDPKLEDKKPASADKSDKPNKPVASTKSANSDKLPDNNSYSLGGKSPFLPNYNIDKRPLSSSVPEKKSEHFEKVSYLGVSDSASEKPRKNVYEKKEIIDLEPEPKSAKKKKNKTVKIIDHPDKKSGIPLFLIIIITIILGAAVGAGVYFLLPK